MAGGLALPPRSAAITADNEFPEIDGFSLDELIGEYPGLMDIDANTDQITDGQYPAQGPAPQARTVAPTNPTPQPQPVAPTVPAPAPGAFTEAQPVPGGMVPVTIFGPSWNGIIGWYFPAVPAVAQQAPAAPPAPFPIAHPGFTPAPSVTFEVPAAPSRTSTPAPPPRPCRPNRKRKLVIGPQSYENEVKRIGASGAPLESIYSPPEGAEYTSQGNEARQKAGSLKTKRGPIAYSKNPLPKVVQPCVCPGRLNIPKRPRNAFILYRSAKGPEIMARNNSGNNQLVSTTAGEWWAAEPEHVKDHYKMLAEREKKRHEEMYPGYRFQPRAGLWAKLGSTSCECGAYEANRAANPGLMGAPEIEDDEPSTPQAGPSRPAAAIRQQQPQARDSIASRLRNRSTISYAEPQEDDLFGEDLFADDLFVPEPAMEEPPHKKRKPSPVNTASQARQSAAALEKTPSLVEFNPYGSPSQNTRSKSRASTEFQTDFAAAGGVNDFLHSLEQINQEPDWSLFNNELATSVNLDGDADTIVMAPRRTSRNSSNGSNGSATRRSTRLAARKSTSPRNSNEK